MYIRPSVVLASPARFGSPHAARITADHSRAASGHGLHHPALHVATIPIPFIGHRPANACYVTPSWCGHALARLTNMAIRPADPAQETAVPCCCCRRQVAALTAESSTRPPAAL